MADHTRRTLCRALGSTGVGVFVAGCVGGSGRQSEAFDGGEPGTSSLPYGDDEWRMSGRDSRNTGSTTATVPASSPAERWRFADERVSQSPPVVVDGTAYFGTADRRLRAVDVAGGTARWSFETDAPVRASPAVVDGTVYFASDRREVYAVDSETWELRWRTGIDAELSSGLAVSRGTVVACGHEDAEVGRIRALDATTGELLWKQETPGRIEDSAAVADGTVYATGRSGGISTFGLGSGDPE